MKKKRLSLFITLAAASMLCGFDSKETPESILQKQQEALLSISSVSAALTVNANIGIDFAGAALKAAANGSINVEVLPEEPALKLEGSIDVLSPLLAQENTYDFKVYLQSDEDTSDLYVYSANAVTGEAGWKHASDEKADLTQLLEIAASADSDRLSDFGVSFSLASEPAVISETECYPLSAVIDSAAFSSVLKEASDFAGEDLAENETAAAALELLDGLKLHLDYYIDTETFLPVKTHLDLNDSDLTAVEELLTDYVATALDSEEDLKIEILLNDVSLDMEAAYNTVTEITVPEEAVTAASEKS